MSNIFSCLHISRYRERMSKDGRDELEQQERTSHRSHNYFIGLFIHTKMFLKHLLCDRCYGRLKTNKQTGSYPRDAYIIIGSIPKPPLPCNGTFLFKKTILFLENMDIKTLFFRKPPSTISWHHHQHQHQQK